MVASLGAALTLGGSAIASSFPTGFGFGAGYGAGVRTGYDIIYPRLAPFAEDVLDAIFGTQSLSNINLNNALPNEVIPTQPNPTSRPSGRGTATLPPTPVQNPQTPTQPTGGRSGRSQPSTAIETGFPTTQRNRDNPHWIRAWNLYKDAVRKTTGNKQRQVIIDQQQWLNNFPANSNNFFE